MTLTAIPPTRLGTPLGADARTAMALARRPWTLDRKSVV